MRAQGFLSRWIYTVNRPRLVHQLRSHLYSSGVSSLDAKEIACAVLVDAENTPYQSLGFVLDRLNDMGYNAQHQTRKVYGAWSKTNLKPYKNIEENLSFTKIDSPICGRGKGTSDAAMIVGAMDILHEDPKIGCFALVTSDSDFTPLVTRLKRAGKVTIGFGRQQTPKELVKEYKEFVFTDEKKSQKKAQKLMNNEQLIESLSETILKMSDDRGWAPLAALDFVRSRLSKGRLNQLGNLIKTCHDKSNWAPVNALEEKFNARLYGYDGMKYLLDDFPELFVHATDSYGAPVVRNKTPKKYIQDLKNAIHDHARNHVGWVRLENIKAPSQVDWRRFGYETVKDVLEDQPEHFLAEEDETGVWWVKIRA